MLKIHIYIVKASKLLAFNNNKIMLTKTSIVLTASATASATLATGVFPKYLTSNVVRSSSAAAAAVIAVTSSTFCPIPKVLSSDNSKKKIIKS